MNPEKIYDVLKDFTSKGNKNKAILIDGVWGIGKTYKLNRFLKEYVKGNKALNVLYLSLFGKESLENIHSELCIKGHPKQFKAKKILKYAFKTISLAVSITPIKNSNLSLDFNLGISESQNKEKKNSTKKIKRKNKTNIVILDDLERKGSALKFDSLLGYLNQLFLDNIKVVVICSEKEISDTDKREFHKFKEKVFDRYYLVTQANEEIIRKYFKDDSLLVDNDMISLLDNNLRTAIKVSLFYFEVLKILTNKKVIFSKKTILWYAFLIVTKFNSTENKESVKESDLSSMEFYRQPMDIRKKLKSLQKFDDQKNHPFKYNAKSYNKISNHDIIEAMYNAYFYDEYDELIDSFTLEDIKEIPILNRNIFLLDEEGKREVIKQKFGFIYAANESLFNLEFLSKLSEMFEYKKYFPQNYNEDELSDFLAKKYIDFNNYLNTAQQIFGTNGFKDFIRKTLKKSVILLKEKLLNDLKLSFESEDFNWIQCSVQKLRFSAIIKDQNQKVDEDCQNFVRKYKFFLPNLSGTITQNIWDISYESCGLSVYLNLANELQDYLKSILNESNDEGEKDRVEALLKYGFIEGRY